MTEEFIRVHKPAYLTQSQAIATPKTPRNARRKSTNLSAKKVKKQDSSKKEESDVLNKVFSIFEEKINKTKQEIHKDLFDSTYDNILQYFNYYALKREICTRGITGEDIIFNPICHVIPTIALFTGINTQDYSCLCDNLSELLRETFTSNLFFINEKNSNNIKSLVNSIFSQWENSMESEEPSVKRNLFTFRYLFESIKSQSQDDAKSGSVIFFFKQFELIPKETIECFVSLISCHMESIPIYFIIELASQTNIIYEQLSSNVISKLCIKKLYLMSPNQYIDRFLTKLFIDETMLFRISGDILKYLIDTYYDYSFSIATFIQALKYCFYEHLKSNDLNSLFVSCELDDINLFETVLDKINQTTANKSQLKSICQSLNENSTSICVQTIQKSWQRYNNQFILVCELLYEIVKRFPCEQDESSLFASNNKSFMDLYIKMCSFSSSKNKTKKFIESEQFLDLKKLLQLSSSNTVNEIVTCLLRIIKSRALSNESSYQGEFLTELHEFYEICDRMKRNLTIQPCDNSFNEEEEQINTSNNADDIYDIDSKLNQLEFLAEASPKTKSRKSSVNRTLKVISENSPSKKRPMLTQQQKKIQTTKMLNTFKTNMIDWLSTQFSIYFDNDYSSQIAFSNYFCYSNLDQVKKRLFDVQRINMHECLLNSMEYMKINKRLENDDESPRKRFKNSRKEASPTNRSMEINSNLLPINVAYKLYLECGHMINLHDWLQAFVDKLENADLNELNPAKRKLMIALFFRSITELQFMGLIKPTSRKVDHVVKLTNGSSLLACE